MDYHPNFFVDSIFNLDFDFLKSKGYKYLLVDIDNTIVPYKNKKPDNKVKQWFVTGQKKDFLFCLISNARKKRVEKIANILSLPFIYMANKPSRKGIFNAIKKINGIKKQSLLIGDQFCTDIIAAKRTKIDCVLVEPLTKNDFFITKIYRLIEWFFKKNFKKENMLDEK